MPEAFSVEREAAISLTVPSCLVVYAEQACPGVFVSFAVGLLSYVISQSHILAAVYFKTDLSILYTLVIAFLGS